MAVWQQLKILPVIMLGIAAILVQPTAAADQSGHAPDWHSDISIAWKEARELGRPMLIYVASNQCTYCRRMEHATLKNPAVVKQVSDGFVRVSINGSNQPQIAHSLRIRSYPTTLVYGHNGKLITSMHGYVGPQEFQQRLKLIKGN